MEQIQKDIRLAKALIENNDIILTESIGKGTEGKCYKYNSIVIKKYDTFSIEEAQDSRYYKNLNNKQSYIERCKKAIEKGVNLVPELDYLKKEKDGKITVYTFMPYFKESRLLEDFQKTANIKVSQFEKFLIDSLLLKQCGLIIDTVSTDNFLISGGGDIIITDPRMDAKETVDLQSHDIDVILSRATLPFTRDLFLLKKDNKEICENQFNQLFLRISNNLKEALSKFNNSKTAISNVDYYIDKCKPNTLESNPDVSK